MAITPGRTSRLVHLARRLDHTLLQKAIDKHHKNLHRQGLRDQAQYLLNELGDFAEELVEKTAEDEMFLVELAGKLESHKQGIHDKLICTVFNEMAKDVQDIVMQGPEAQLRYLVQRHGLEKTQKIVEKLMG